MEDKMENENNEDEIETDVEDVNWLAPADVNWW